jgi:hypothetical protein
MGRAWRARRLVHELGQSVFFDAYHTATAYGLR